MTRSRRYEFTKSVMREALARSGGRCEATGEVYGLDAGHRCYALFKGGLKEFDHYPLPATVEGSDTVDNCVVCCPEHHAFKTATFDIPVQAKAKRVSDKHNGIAGKRSTWGTRPLGTGNRQHTATSPIRRKSDLAMEAQPE